MPQTVGTGTAVLQRWYFDRFAGHCEMFTYTGIGGNGNNFLTEQECHRKCGSGWLFAIVDRPTTIFHIVYFFRTSIATKRPEQSFIFQMSSWRTNRIRSRVTRSLRQSATRAKLSTRLYVSHYKQQ